MRDDELQFYVNEREELLKERDRQEKLWRENSSSIAEIVLENILSMGLYRETWNLVKEQVHIYSERSEKLYIQPGTIENTIRKYLRELKDVGSVQYLPLEDKVVLRSNPTSNSMLCIEFTIGKDVKDFICRNKIKIRDNDIESKIKELQRIQQEYKC